MSRRRHTPEQIITALREAEVGLANGKTVGMVSRELGISEQTYYRWRQEFGGMKVDQARRFKELEKENARLKRAVANLTVDKLILEGSDQGKLLSPERRRRCVVHVRQRLGASERHACHVLGQPRSTQRRVKKVRVDESALRTDVIRLASRVRQVRVSTDHEPATHRGLGGEPQACGADLEAGGAESAQTATETGSVVAQRWLVHPAQATA